MRQEQVKLRLDEDIKKISEIYHDTFHKSRNQFIQDAYEQAIISDLMSSNPMEPVSADMIAALENLLNTRIKRIEEEQAKNQWLIEYIAAHRIVSDENLHNNLNEILNQISVIDQAIRFYGTPKIDTRITDILKTRLNSQVITKVGKMFLQLHSDKSFNISHNDIYNELIGCIQSTTEQEFIFQNNPTQEKRVILHIVDVFYREQLNKMADEIHENINHQITAQKTDVLAHV